MVPKAAVYFAIEELGQDMIEYALLLGFVCMASAAVFVISGVSFAGIWSSTNSVVSRASTLAAS